MTPNAEKQLPIQKSVTNLDTMSTVVVGKKYTFVPVGSTEEALQRVANDTKKFLALINEGLQAETRRIASADPNGWMEFDEDGEITATPFTGTIGDPKAVNALVLTLAKTVFGYNADLALADRNKAKSQAMDMIKSTPAIRDGLKKSAALTAVTTE